MRISSTCLITVHVHSLLIILSHLSHSPHNFFSPVFFSQGLALITQKEALLWTDGRYFLQAAQQLSDQWKLMRMGEDPAVDLWMADVCDHLSFDVFLNVVA